MERIIFHVDYLYLSAYASNNEWKDIEWKYDRSVIPKKDFINLEKEIRGECVYKRGGELKIYNISDGSRDMEVIKNGKKILGIVASDVRKIYK